MKNVGRNIAISLGVVCIILVASLAGTISNYTLIINEKQDTIVDKDSTISSLNWQIASKDAQIAENNDEIASLNAQIADKNVQINTLTNETVQLQAWLAGNVSALNSQIGDLQGQLASANSQISSLNADIATLQNQINDLKALINVDKQRLEALVFHVCDKGDGSAWNIPDVNYTYNQILSLNNGSYNVLLLPEYQGHSNWSQELEWITDNFGGKDAVPIMLDVFCGGPESVPTPMLSTNDILNAMTAANVKYLRIAEVISWHIEHALPFPTEYITTMLTFARANNLKVFWTEWKADHLPSVETFKAIQKYIVGYEDIVTVSFSTNSGDLEPADGFLTLNNMFQHWSASVQAWYWATRYDTDLLNMPISLLIQHALAAKNMGAEIIQFEPYWYFFDNGEPKENLRLLLTLLR